MTTMTRDAEYSELYRFMAARIDVRKLEHCMLCNEPMYCIYASSDGTRKRRYCYPCDVELGNLKGSTSRETLRVAAG